MKRKYSITGKKDLKGWGWVKERKVKREGKGRPLKSYKLATNLKDIVQETVNQKKEEVKKAKEELNELEEIIGRTKS